MFLLTENFIQSHKLTDVQNNLQDSILSHLFYILFYFFFLNLFYFVLFCDIFWKSVLLYSALFISILCDKINFQSILFCSVLVQFSIILIFFHFLKIYLFIYLLIYSYVYLFIYIFMYLFSNFLSAYVALNSILFFFIIPFPPHFILDNILLIILF